MIPSRLQTSSTVEAGAVVWLAGAWRTIDDVTSDIERGGIRRVVLWCGRTGYRLALTTRVTVRSAGAVPATAPADEIAEPGRAGASAMVSTAGPRRAPRSPARPSTMVRS